MNKGRFNILMGLAFGLLAIGGATGMLNAGSSPKAATLDGNRIARASIQEPGSWLTHGGNYAEDRFSRLTQIDTGNVGRLGLSWSYDLDVDRGQETTPLMIDGVLYVSTSWSKVVALDAVTGRHLWTFDPQVPREVGFKACCDVVNRGVAAWGDNVFIGTIDGRLIAINRRTGKQAWSVVTVDQSQPYTITGAPRVVKGKVIIGNGGAEYGVRGYVTAYDAVTGAQKWRFYTVPGDPAKGFEEIGRASCRERV